MTMPSSADAAIAHALDQLRADLETRGLLPHVAAQRAEAARACLAVSGDGQRLQVYAPNGRTPILGPAPLKDLSRILYAGAGVADRPAADTTPDPDTVARYAHEQAQRRAGYAL
jgi:hypothetical protein